MIIIHGDFQLSFFSSAVTLYFTWFVWLVLGFVCKNPNLTDQTQLNQTLSTKSNLSKTKQTPPN